MPATIQTHATHLKAAFFNGFADPSRLAILEALRDGPLTVGEIVEATGLSQPNTSNHLRCLRDCGVLVSEKQGRYVYYGWGTHASRRCCDWPTNGSTRSRTVSSNAPTAE